MGARHIAPVQSLLVTCRPYDVNPADGVVDKLLRFNQHPAALVERSASRAWRTMFASNSSRSGPYQRQPRESRHSGGWCDGIDWKRILDRCCDMRARHAGSASDHYF